MITIRKANERGHFDFGWLNTYHTFSFGDYHDPKHMGFRCLRVINDDKVQPGEGFPTHGHRDMEIVTYILDGALEHKDSMQNGSVIKPGDVQRMSAGRGVRHSEFNASKDKEVHLLQIWILPKTLGTDPGYEQKFFKREEKTDTLLLVASPDGRQGSVTVHQDTSIYSAILSPKAETSYELRKGRGAWIQVAKGELTLNGHTLKAGDGAAVEDEKILKFKGIHESEILVFDLPE